MAAPRVCSKRATAPEWPPTPRTPSDSSMARRAARTFPRPSGSTRRRKRRTRMPQIDAIGPGRPEVVPGRRTYAAFPETRGHAARAGRGSRQDSLNASSGCLTIVDTYREEPIMENDTRIAVDVAKTIFEVAISDRPGHVVRRERLTREPVPALHRPPAGGDRGHGGVRLRSSLGPEDPEARPPRGAATASPSPALRAGKQDRPRRRESDPGGLPQRGDPPGPGEVE